jgi:hypothetical protein
VNGHSVVMGMVHLGRKSTKAYPRASVVLCGMGPRRGACHEGAVGQTMMHHRKCHG